MHVRIPPLHSGVALRDEFLAPMGLSIYAFGLRRSGRRAAGSMASAATNRGSRRPSRSGSASFSASIRDGS
jgi:hypothetical protein